MSDPRDDDAPAEYASPPCLMHELAEEICIEAAGEAAVARPQADGAAPRGDGANETAPGADSAARGEARRSARPPEAPAQLTGAARRQPESADSAARHSSTRATSAAADASTARPDVSSTRGARA